MNFMGVGTLPNRHQLHFEDLSNPHIAVGHEHPSCWVGLHKQPPCRPLNVSTIQTHFSLSVTAIPAIFHWHMKVSIF